ncbi:AMP-binding protein [Streptomyces sp. NPDC003077]|uniref:AMP-binding protein n=1 Tax=Streptomyces sp. NPDC003077 TaxID=3154443 RepID=UPI00339DEDEC
MISEHVDTAQEPAASRIALSWAGEPGRLEELTHGMLLGQADRAAAALTRLGVRAGDRVAVHLPLVPESVIVTLACGHLDAVRTTLPVGAPAHELASRVAEAGARVVITADAGFWDGAVRPVKAVLDRALRSREYRAGARWAAGSGGPGGSGGSGADDLPGVRAVLVVNRSARPVGWTPGRDQWWHEALEAE